MRVRLVFLALALATPLVAHADKLNAKPGLWEITSKHVISGAPPVPKELADKLTPEQRAQMEAAFRKEAQQGLKTDVERECITKEKMERPFEAPDSKECKQTIVRTTATTQEVRLECQGEYQGSGIFKVTTPTPESMTGTLDFQHGTGAEVMKVKSDIKGRWLGPDCGDEDDNDDEAGRLSDEDERDDG